MRREPMVGLRIDELGLERLKFPNRRAFLRWGARLAAGTSMAVAAGERKALASDGLQPVPSTAGAELGANLSRGDASIRSGRAYSTDAKRKMHPLGIFLANHDQDTGMHLWKLDRWNRQIASLKRMGADTVWFLPMEFGQHSCSDFTDMAPYWKLQRDICRRIADSGLETGIYVGVNDICIETFNQHPEWRAVRGDYALEECEVCPSVPAARREILRLREKLFAELPHLDYLLSEITDYSGCACNMCAPWPKTYVSMLQEFADLCRRYHPAVKVVASGIGAYLPDVDLLRASLRAASWADYVWDVPRGPKPIIRAALDPDITMHDGWGRFGPCPMLGTIKHAWESEYNLVTGDVHYSEGIHDDVNKFALLQLGRDPGQPVNEVGRAYAEDWLGLSGRQAALAGQVIAGLGTRIGDYFRYNYYDPDYGASNPEADDRLKILVELRTSVPKLKDNFRYWLLDFRAVWESFTTIEGSLSLEALNREVRVARDALSRLEPEYGHYLARVSGAPEYPPGPWRWPRAFHAAWKRENNFVGQASLPPLRRLTVPSRKAAFSEPGVGRDAES